MWQDVERQYGVRVVRRDKVRDVFMLHTKTHGTLCLKPYTVNQTDVHFIASVIQFLQLKGFPYAPQVFPTTDASLWITSNGQYYTLTNWVTGTSPDFSRPSDLSQAIRVLARFHGYAAGFSGDVPGHRLKVLRWPNVIQDTRKVLSKRKHVDAVDELLGFCDLAEGFASSAAVKRGVEREYQEGALVHGDYNYPNLVKDHTGAIHLIDFDNTSLYVRMEDLAHILHRNCAWNGDQMHRCIEVYDRARPLDQADCEILRTLLTIPYPAFRAMRQFRRNPRAIKRRLPSRSQLQSYKAWLRRGL